MLPRVNFPQEMNTLAVKFQVIPLNSLLISFLSFLMTGSADVSCARAVHEPWALCKYCA